MPKNWKTESLDIDYFLDSGLLFLINRTVLHPLGIAMTVQVDKQGSKVWGFKDCRGKPNELVLDKHLATIGKTKLEKYLREFGFDQMRLREQELGWACQPIPEEKK